jgi:PAS domain S-box-containing protein
MGEMHPENIVGYKALVESIPAVVYMDAADEVSSALYMSPRAEEMLGYATDEWLYDPELWVRSLHPDDRERVIAEHERTRETGKPFKVEYRLVAKDGRVVWVRDEAAPAAGENGGAPVWWGVLVDITERKEAEESLRRSEQRFRLVARATSNVIWDSDLLAGEQGWHGALESAFGYPLRQVTDNAWWKERLHPEDRERVLRSINAILRPGGGEAWSDRYRFRRSDGSYAHVEDRGYVVRDETTGEAMRMVGSMVDVTEQRQAEERLKESEKLFRTTFEAAAVGIAHVAPDGRWLRINEKLCEISGYSREELLGTTFQTLTPKEDLATSLERLGQLLRGEIGSYTVERRYVKKDGSRVWVDLSVSLVNKGSISSTTLSA